MPNNYSTRFRADRGDGYVSMLFYPESRSVTRSWGSIPTRERPAPRESQDSKTHRRSPESRPSRLENPSPRLAEDRGRSTFGCHNEPRPSGTRSSHKFEPSPTFDYQRTSRSRPKSSSHQERSKPPRSDQHDDRLDRLMRQVDRLFKAVRRRDTTPSRGRSLPPTHRSR